MIWVDLRDQQDVFAGFDIVQESTTDSGAGRVEHVEQTLDVNDEIAEGIVARFGQASDGNTSRAIQMSRARAVVNNRVQLGAAAKA